MQPVVRSAKLTGRTLHIKGKLDATLAEQYFEIPEQQRRKIRTLAVQDVETVYNGGLLPIAADLLRLTSHQLRVYGADQPHLNHLFDLYGWRGVIEQRPKRLIPRNPVALVRYRDTDDVNLYVTRSMNEVMRRFVCGKDIVKGFEWSYNEILGNVLDHADSPLGGFAQINYFRSSKRLNMIVVDTGNGLKTTLSESHHDIEDDRAAIALAIQKGITRNTEIGQGNGLWGTTQIVKAVHGNLRVWSGSGELWVTADGEEHYSTVPFFHGTLVGKSQLEMRSLYNLPSRRSTTLSQNSSKTMSRFSVKSVSS